MERTSGRTRCVTCQKDKTTSECNGCLQDFCFNHLGEHRQELGQQLAHVENQRNLFRQVLSDQITNREKHTLFEQINRWEEQSILKIRQTGNEARQLLVKHFTEHVEKIEMKLRKLTEEIKEVRDENDFNEININELKRKLKDLEEQNQPKNIPIKVDSSTKSFINKISVFISSEIQQSATSSPPTKYSSCGGRTCVKCGYCCDWYYKNGWQRYPGSTCQGGVLEALILHGGWAFLCSCPRK